MKYCTLYTKIYKFVLPNSHLKCTFFKVSFNIFRGFKELVTIILYSQTQKNVGSQCIVTEADRVCATISIIIGSWHDQSKREKHGFCTSFLCRFLCVNRPSWKDTVPVNEDRSVFSLIVCGCVFVSKFKFSFLNHKIHHYHCQNSGCIFKEWECVWLQINKNKSIRNMRAREIFKEEVDFVSFTSSFFKASCRSKSHLSPSKVNILSNNSLQIDWSSPERKVRGTKEK